MPIVCAEVVTCTCNQEKWRRSKRKSPRWAWTVTAINILPLFCCSGVLIILGSVLVLIFNIGVPNDLKGFLFFAQVVGFVYRHGAADDDDSLSLV